MANHTTQPMPDIDTSRPSIIGVASCIGASNTSCESAPLTIASLNAAEVLNADWDITLAPDFTSGSENNPEQIIAELCRRLATETARRVTQNRFFTVFAGDHSSAIGTWSGVSNTVNPDTLGLIWIDAHMDAHTPETSPSGAIHGMPVACLLGEGPDTLCNVGGNFAKINPENLVLIGIRSYEKGEAELLSRLGVKVFHMEDVIRQGLESVIQQTVNYLQPRCQHVGVSIDLDAIDPSDAPGVGSVASHGLNAIALLDGLNTIRNALPLVGCEIVELNPTLDINHKTARLAIDLACALAPETD